VNATSAESKSPEDDKYYCYLYREPKSQRILYVGYATKANRALTTGHNEGVVNLGKTGQDYEIWIAGPYESESAARNVEAALVSAISPKLNEIQQPGIKFRPLGMPSELVGRRSQKVLDIYEVGVNSGGAIIVYCNFTSQLKSGKPKLTLTNFSDDVVFDNIQEHWYVKKLLPKWISNPETSPRTLVAVQGPPADRVIVGSAEIDIHGWTSAEAAPWDPSVYRIPLNRDMGLDCHELRGRRIDVKFNTGKANYVMVVDNTGALLHGYRSKK
jgi:hypothetical protein